MRGYIIPLTNKKRGGDMHLSINDQGLNSVGLKNSLIDGLAELRAAAILFRLWSYWGWLDVRQRYRRSLLGPFWVTITMAVSIIATGLVYSFIFNQEVSGYLPYVATGYTLWSLIAGFIGDACNVFILSEGYITQINMPYLIYPLKMLWRYIIIFVHHLFVLTITLMVFNSSSLMNFGWILLGLIGVVMNIFWVGLILGLVTAKYRDMPLIVSSLLQILFMVTPIIWPASSLGTHFIVAEYNPFFHWLESVRGPLLQVTGNQDHSHLIITLITALLGNIVSLIFYSRIRLKLVYLL
jgi:ABC-type polysaccharide/polyol phosphate export permease